MQAVAVAAAAAAAVGYGRTEDNKGREGEEALPLTCVQLFLQRSLRHCLPKRKTKALRDTENKCMV